MNRMDYTKQPELEIKLPEDREQELLAWANKEESPQEKQEKAPVQAEEAPKPAAVKLSAEEELRGELQQLLSQFAEEEAASKAAEPEELPTEEKTQEAEVQGEESPEETPKEEASMEEASKEEASQEAAKEVASEETKEASAPAQKPEEPLAAVSYESVAQAVEEAQKAPGASETREYIDDETLLAELYALIGDSDKDSKPAAPVSKLPEEKASDEELPAPEPREPKPMPILNQEELEATVEEEELLLEEDPTGAPGWLKGAFLLLVSLLLSAMTFYAVASDVMGKVF